MKSHPQDTDRTSLLETWKRQYCLSMRGQGAGPLIRSCTSTDFISPYLQPFFYGVLSYQSSPPPNSSLNWLKANEAESHDKNHFIEITWLILGAM